VVTGHLATTPGRELYAQLLDQAHITDQCFDAASRALAGVVAAHALQPLLDKHDRIIEKIKANEHNPDTWQHFASDFLRPQLDEIDESLSDDQQLLVGKRSVLMTTLDRERFNLRARLIAASGLSLI